jgi:dihydroneopterin aldolase
LTDRAPQDLLRVTGLRVRAVLGVHVWERREPRPVTIDLEVPCDGAAAAKEDDLDRALDYHRLSRAVRDAVEETEFRLVESLAEFVAGLVLREFSPAWVRVRVHKPGAVPDADDVSLEIERSLLPRRG